MALVKCKECKSEISTQAKACPKCGARAPYRWGIGKVIIAIVFLFFSMAFFLPMINDNKNEIDIAGASSMDAYIAATNFVSANLKNPHTANFCAHVASEIKKIGNDTCSVSSYVDAKNDFGAEKRTHFTAKIKHLGNKKWKLIDLKMNRG